MPPTTFNLTVLSANIDGNKIACKNKDIEPAVCISISIVFPSIFPGEYFKDVEPNDAPSDLTDLEWANGDEGEDIAKEYLTQWIDWMYNPKITFKTHYNIVNDWEETHRFTVNFPHQTNGTTIECILTKIVLDPNSPYHVTIEAIMFVEPLPVAFNYQDSWDTIPDPNDWVDTMTVQGDDDDKIDNM